ncbi:MAG: sigma-70 family RNA polymerase sigma factor [Verrucomicrobiales bacterium]
MLKQIHSQETPDSELMRRFVEDACEQSFRELVERHASMVFSVALRRSGDWQTAEEAAQNVFRALAKKAPDLSADVVLAGWLHKAALFEAASMQRAESTRTRKMNDATDALASELQADAEPDPQAWSELTPFIDAAIDQLPAGDRDVVLLRFYQGMTYREIGDRLGKNESSARKHTLRALKSLGGLLRSRGVSLPAAAIGGGIAFGFAGAAPPAFGKSFAASLVLPAAPVAVATGGASTSIAALVAAALVIGAVPFAFQWQRQARAVPENLAIPEGGERVPLRSQLAGRSGGRAGSDRSFDLESVFAVRGTERLRRLAYWLPGASEEEVHAAAELLMVDQRSPVATMSVSNHNFDMAWSAIFARWAELDPQRLIAYAREAPHPRFSFMKFDELLESAFGAWARIDPAAAITAAASESPKVQMAVINRFVQSDPEMALELAASVPIGQARRGLNYSGLFESLARRDLAAAAERVRGISDARLQLVAAGGLLSVWAGRDPEAALEYVESLPGFEARSIGRDAVLVKLIESDRVAALPLITALPPGISRSMLMRSLARTAAAAEPDEARAWAETLDSAQDRRAAYAGIAIALSKTDTDAAFAALDELGWDLRDPGSATTYEPSGSGPSRSIAGESLASVAISMITELAKSDPRAALRYAFQVGNSHWTSPLGDIARSYVSEDPAGAMAFAAGLEQGAMREELAVHVATTVAASDPVEAMTWAAQLDGSAGEQAQTAVFRSIASEDPQTAAASLDRLPQTAGRDKAIRFLAESWLQRDYEGASRWVQGHADIDSIAPAVRTYLERWSERDPRAASEWVATLPEGAAMQEGVIGLVGWMINQPAMDHQAAFEWTDRISATDRARHFYFELIAKDWLEHDPVAGRGALDQTDLPDEVKERLLNRHDRSE